MTVTLSEVISVCGDYTRKNGSNYIFPCPICRLEGHDNSGDNVTYSSNKGILKCFLDDNHSTEILRMINKKNGGYVPSYTPIVDNKPKQWEINRKEYLEYMMQTMDILQDDKRLLEYVYCKRGLTPDTCFKVGLGYDPTEESFVLPIFSLKYDCIVDFELRKKSDKKQIRRVGGGCNTIAQIYGKRESDTLYITEGMIDGYTLVEWLLSKGMDNFTVYSCSNGVSSLFNVMDEIYFSKFKTIKLMLDNDDAGNKATEQILSKYPFIKDSRKFLVDSNCNDVSEYYVRKVVKNEI